MVSKQAHPVVKDCLCDIIIMNMIFIHDRVKYEKVSNDWFFLKSAIEFDGSFGR